LKKKKIQNFEELWFYLLKYVWYFFNCGLIHILINHIGKKRFSHVIHFSSFMSYISTQCEKGFILFRRRAWVLAEGKRSQITERHVLSSRHVLTAQVLFLLKAELNFFHFFRNSDRLAGTFSWSEDPSTAWLVPSTAEDPAC
jgi:hypothetical protein